MKNVIIYPIIALILLATTLHAQNARDIINRYLDTVSNGNIHNWTKIKSTYTESEVYYSQQDFEQKPDLLQRDKANFHKSYRVVPNSHKIEIYEDSTFTKKLSTFYYLKNRTILLLGNLPPIVKPATPRRESSSQDLPVHIWNLMQQTKSVELLGIKQFPHDGIECYEIKITAKDQSLVLYINTGTFLLDFCNRRKDGDMSFLAKFNDYKQIDGFLIPMSDYLMRNGIVYYWRHIRKIELNSCISQEVFEYHEK